METAAYIISGTTLLVCSFAWLGIMIWFGEGTKQIKTTQRIFIDVLLAALAMAGWVFLFVTGISFLAEA
jgi:hypothetical protein